MPKIQLLQKKYKKSRYLVHTIVIPKEIMEEKNWKKGDELEFKNYNGRIYLSKKG